MTNSMTNSTTNSTTNSQPAPGWWLASDGNWYAPDQVSASASTTPATEIANKGVLVLMGLALVFVLGVAALGGGYFLTRGGTTKAHWAPETRATFVAGCVIEGAGTSASLTPSTCGCWADGLANAGVTESDMQTLDEHDTKSAVNAKVEKAAAKCHITGV
jgi:hypothetical protein